MCVFQVFDVWLPNGLIPLQINAQYPSQSSYLNQNRYVVWIKSLKGILSASILCMM